MPSLTVRDIPKATLDKMRRAAKAEHRSLNSQAVYWLEQAADRWTERPNRAELVRRIRELREAMLQRYGPSADAVELVRMSRRRGRD